jgi:hypothetical protein
MALAAMLAEATTAYPPDRSLPAGLPDVHVIIGGSDA